MFSMNLFIGATIKAVHIWGSSEFVQFCRLFRTERIETKWNLLLKKAIKNFKHFSTFAFWSLFLKKCTNYLRFCSFCCWCSCWWEFNDEKRPLFPIKENEFIVAGDGKCRVNATTTTTKRARRSIGRPTSLRNGKIARTRLNNRSKLNETVFLFVGLTFLNN